MWIIFIFCRHIETARFLVHSTQLRSFIFHLQGKLQQINHNLKFCPNVWHLHVRETDFPSRVRPKCVTWRSTMSTPSDIANHHPKLLSTPKALVDTVPYQNRLRRMRPQRSSRLRTFTDCYVLSMMCLACLKFQLKSVAVDVTFLYHFFCSPWVFLRMGFQNHRCRHFFNYSNLIILQRTTL